MPPTQAEVEAAAEAAWLANPRRARMHWSECSEEYRNDMRACQRAALEAAERVRASSIEGELGQRAEKDEAYRQRNHLVAALARLFPSGIARTNISGWSPDWHGCCFIDLPSGQISYHYHDSHAHLFEGLPPYTKVWDGHDKEAVHARLAAIPATSNQRATT